MSPSRVAEALRALADAVATEEPRPTEVLSAPTGPAFMTRGAYAERVSLSPRTLDTLIARGLPCIGRARLLRVDVVAADRWLREHLADERTPESGLDDEDEVSRAAQASVDRALRGAR